MKGKFLSEVNGLSHPVKSSEEIFPALFHPSGMYRQHVYPF
jgi:hypothetical protein